MPTLLAAAAASSSSNSNSTTNNNGTTTVTGATPTPTIAAPATINHSHLVHPGSYVTSSSATDSSSSQHHPYAYTNMAAAAQTTKLSNTPANLLVDSTSHLPEIINVPSSSSIMEVPNSHTQPLSTNELINNDNVCESKENTRLDVLEQKTMSFLRLNQTLLHLIHRNRPVR